MKLTSEQLGRAYSTFINFNGSSKNSLGAAIEEFVDTMFKPGPMMTLEPLEAIPQRDYRKEAWIAAIGRGNSDYANLVLQHFDATFPPEPTHG